MARAKTAKSTKTPMNGNSESKATATLNAAPVKANGNSSQAELEAEIRRRAYELYLQRGCTPGRENEDWIVAEREIVARFNHHQGA